MGNIPKANIINGNTINAADVSNIINALDGTTAYDITISGSLAINTTLSSGSGHVLTYNTSSGLVTYTASSAGGGSPTAPGGSNTQIQFNSASIFSGSSNFTFDYVSRSLQQGSSVTASGIYSHAEGSKTTASGTGSHAEGSGSQAIGNYSHAEGSGSYSGAYAYLVSGSSGNNIVLNPSYGNVTSSFISSTVFIYDASRVLSQVLNFSASSYDSMTGKTTVGVSGSMQFSSSYILPNPMETGNYTPLNADQVFGLYSHAKGGNTQAIGDISYAEGEVTQAVGYASHAEGYDTRANGVTSHAEGNRTTANDYSHAEGLLTQALGVYSHAEGQSTLASGPGSHAQNFKTIASGQFSHAEGSASRAEGMASHAEGLGTIAFSNYSHAQGKYNQTSSIEAAFIIGNGTSGAARSNLLFAGGSEVQITGSLLITGSTTLSGSFNIHNLPTASSLTNIIVYNSASGQLTYTSSAAIGGGGSTPDLQAVTTEGAITTDTISVVVGSIESKIEPGIISALKGSIGVSITGLGTVEISDGTNTAIVQASTLTDSVTLEIPDKGLGTFTIATTDDLLTPAGGLNAIQVDDGSGNFNGSPSASIDPTNSIFILGGPHFITGTANAIIGKNLPGKESQMSGSNSLVVGIQNLLTGSYNFVAGSGNSLKNADNSITLGASNEIISGSNASVLAGVGLIASGSGQVVAGRWNAQGDSTSPFIVGIGSGSDGARQTGFKVTQSGSMITKFGTFGGGAPSWTGSQGELVVGKGSGTAMLWLYLGIGGINGWVSASFSS